MAVRMSLREARQLIDNDGEYPNAMPNKLPIYVIESESATSSIMGWILCGFTVVFSTIALAMFIMQSWVLLAVSLAVATLFFVGYRVERGE